MNKSYKLIFERLLWGNFEPFHQRIIQNNDNINKIIKVVNSISFSLEEYIKTINLQKIKASFETISKHTLLYKTFYLFINSFEIQLTQFNLGFKLIKEQLVELIKPSKTEDIKNELFLYNELKKNKDEYFDSKNLLIKCKNKYYNYMTETIAALSNEKQFMNLTIKLKTYFDKYKTYVENTKNLRKTYINSQKNMIYFYLNNEKNEGKIILGILKEYIDHQRIYSDILQNCLKDNLSISSKLKIYNDFDIIANNIQKNNTIINEDIINYIDYNPKNDFNIYQDSDSYKNYIESIIKLRKNVDKNLFPSISISKEKKKNELGEIISKIFAKDNKDNSDDNIENIYQYFKFEDTSTHLYFLEILTILRGNGKFCRKEKTIKILANIINDILLNAELIKDFNIGQKCILLSQTYYYMENNNKKYLSVFIQKNKWLRNPDFWRNHISNGLKEEILTFNEKNPIIAKEKNKKNKYSELIFSCLITHFNNMKYFLLEKRVVKKIVNEFLYKINLDKQYLPNIINILK